MNETLTGSEVVKLNSEGTFTVQDSTRTLPTGCFPQLTWDYPDYWNYHCRYYPVYYSYPCYEKSKIEQAFKIVGKLIENKIIEKELTVKDFIKLVNDIAGLI
jgi:hypothetical protein